MHGGTIAMENGAVCLKTQNQDPRAPWQGTSGVYPKELALTNTCAARVMADRGGSGRRKRAPSTQRDTAA